MASSNWKKVELAKCRALGGERSGPTGRDTPDCKDIHVALEVKAYKRFVFLTADWNQAVENAAKVGLPPVLNVREGGRGGRDCVQMYPYDWIDLEARVPDEADIVTETLPRRTPANLVRMPWDYFVALYRAAYIDRKESVG